MDSDSCLEAAPAWRGWGYICTSAIDYCDSYAKDLRRCCPETCNTGVLTEDDCNALNGDGDCIYPNEAQCEGNYY